MEEKKPPRQGERSLRDIEAENGDVLNRSSFIISLSYHCPLQVSKLSGPPKPPTTRKKEEEEEEMPPINLTPDSIDDLIYDARTGDLAALQSDLSTLSVQYSCPQALIIASAIDAEPESEGGTGSCLLHFPAANGNLEILSHLLQILGSSPGDLGAEQVKAVVNHRNHSGNTPLHWAALNTHLECVKVLVEAGADISIQNQAGLDAVFLAERADWGVDREEQEQEEGNEGKEGEEEASLEVGEDSGSASGPVSKGRQVVEWLLASDKGGELEGGIGGDGK